MAASPPTNPRPSFELLISLDGGVTHRIFFAQDEVSIGRHEDCDLVLPAPNISATHCRIICRDSRFILIDAESTNGTYVNGVRVDEPTLVRGVDVIALGPYALRIDPEVEDVEIEIEHPRP